MDCKTLSYSEFLKKNIIQPKFEIFTQFQTRRALHNCKTKLDHKLPIDLKSLKLQKLISYFNFNSKEKPKKCWSVISCTLEASKIFAFYAIEDLFCCSVKWRFSEVFNLDLHKHLYFRGMRDLEVLRPPNQEQN